MLKMRELKAKDTFKIVAIINKTGAVKSVKALMGGELGKDIVAQFKSKEEREKNIESIGVTVMAEIAEHVLGNLEKAEEPINNLLANLTGKTVGEIEELPLHEYTALIINFFKKPELKSFLESIKPLLV